MLYNDFTEKLTGLQDLIVTKVEDNEKEIHIYGEMKRKSHKCPCCGKYTDKVHDYREQSIKDIPSFGRKTIIHLRKRRYRCECGKRFFGLCQEKCVRFFKKLINQCFFNRGGTPSVRKNGGQIMCSYFSIRALILSFVTSWFLTIAQF